MEPKFEPKQYTPEEIAQLEKSRTISDAELLKGGAEYAVNEKGEKENLIVTEEQRKHLHWEGVGKKEGEEKVEKWNKANDYIFDHLSDDIMGFFRKFEKELRNTRNSNYILSYRYTNPEKSEVTGFVNSSEVSSELREAWEKFVPELSAKARAVIETSSEDSRNFIKETLKDHTPGCTACLHRYLQRNANNDWAKYLNN